MKKSRQGKWQGNGEEKTRKWAKEKARQEKAEQGRRQGKGEGKAREKAS
jgi:hypothetical protein